MKNEYKIKSDRYGHTHKMVSINGDGNPYAFVPEADWMPLYYSSENGNIFSVDTDGGPFLTAGWANDEITIESICTDVTGSAEFYLKENAPE